MDTGQSIPRRPRRCNTRYRARPLPVHGGVHPRPDLRVYRAATACARGHPSACRGFSLGPLGVVQFIFSDRSPPAAPALRRLQLVTGRSGGGAVDAKREKFSRARVSRRGRAANTGLRASRIFLSHLRSELFPRAFERHTNILSYTAGTYTEFVHASCYGCLNYCSLNSITFLDARMLIINIKFRFDVLKKRVGTAVG